MYQGTLNPRSNRAGWTFTVEVKDQQTGDLIDLSDADITFDVRDKDSDTVKLSATVDNDLITIVDTGHFQVSFTDTNMRTLCAKTYEVGCIISNADSEPQQLIVASLPIIDGVVQ